jgi:hypothetical protein
MMSKEKAVVSITLPPLDADDICERVVMRLADEMRESVSKKLNEMIKDKFDDGVRKAADKAVADFLKKSLPKTNQWGEGKGESVTLTEYVIDKFKDHMMERVRADGTRGDQYGSGDKLPTRHQWLIEQFGTKEIVKVAQAEIEKVRKTAEAQVSAAVGNFIAQNLVAPVAAIAIGNRK